MKNCVEISTEYAMASSPQRPTALWNQPLFRSIKWHMRISVIRKSHESISLDSKSKSDELDLVLGM